MLLCPKDRRFKKDRKGGKGVISGIAVRGSTLDKGSFGLKALCAGRITAAQIESTRKVIARTLKRTGKIFIRVFPAKPITKKPSEVRMGGGKGALEHWVYLAKPGKILLEISGVTSTLARQALVSARYKLPLRTAVVGGQYEE